MLEYELVPVKNQKFDIGRTINFTKCKCDKCDFLHCDNYAKKMQLKENVMLVQVGINRLKELHKEV